ncbi:MAG: hypothetical protein J6I49_00815 [Bacteroidales bacterium]|nr:hypothetical protein [Bacteroidales bacterium]
MAIIEQGILGGFRGRVGTVVGYWRKGRWCIRARAVAFRDARSAAQLVQRSRFKAMIGLASRMGAAVQRGLTQASDEHGLTEGNLFMRINNQCFTHTAEGVRVDYRALRLALGRLPNVAFGAPQVDGARVELPFDKQKQLHGARNEDVVHVYAYVPALGEGRFVAAVPRRAKRAAFLLPDEYLGLEVHLYGFAERSETASCGTLSVAQKRRDKRLRNLPRTVSTSAYIACLDPQAPLAHDAGAEHISFGQSDFNSYLCKVEYAKDNLHSADTVCVPHAEGAGIPLHGDGEPPEAAHHHPAVRLGERPQGVRDDEAGAGGLRERPPVD